MKWTRGTRSAHLKDRRGSPAKRATIGVGGAVALLVALFFGKDYLGFLGGGDDGKRQVTSSQPAGQGNQGIPAENDPDAELVDFISFVLDDIQSTWTKQFPAQLNRAYEPANLVLFSKSTDESACGFATAAIGPFYCPADKQAYIDLSFYRDLSARFGAPGDFAQAYVIAHEIGHHIQNLLGTSGRVHRQRKQLSEREGNALTIKLELQADCYAGVWAHSTQKRDLLDKGDVEEGIGAASAVGDDRLQKQATGKIQPETWTHGSSAQRVRWFKKGLASGEVADCDTFSAASL